MPKLSAAPSVLDYAPACAASTLTHFENLLRHETDCWDVEAAMRKGNPGFVLVDVRLPTQYAAGHVPGAVNIPYGTMSEETLASYPPETVFVVYCSGPHCNGADRAAAILSRLERPVKKMIGGVQGWGWNGFSLDKK